MAVDPTVRSIVDLRNAIQKSRIQFGNRIAAIERGDDAASPVARALLQKWYEQYLELEDHADTDVAEMVKDEAIVKQLVELKGIGLQLAAKLVSMIDIERPDSVSALWKFAGYAVVDGVRERPVKGQKLGYNARLKTACYLVGVSFLRCNSPYRKIYDDARTYYAANRPDWSEGRRHAAALRKMIKMFLSHLWLRWRELEGLSIRPPYVHERLGHASVVTPEEMGWPSKEAEVGAKKPRTRKRAA